MLISIAIPCYNSSKTIRNVVAEIKSVFTNKSDDFDYEIILINDNSPDNTFEIIQELCAEDKKIVGVNLSKNYGQASAQMAAIRFIKGDIAVFMDDDGQHPANEIFKLVDKIQEGNDLVYAYFPHKKHTAFKRITSKINAKMLEFANTKPKGIVISSFFAIDALAIKMLKKYHSPYPFIGGYLLQVTRKIANVDVQHRERMEGTSNYTLKRLLTLWLQGITNFSITPLRFASIIGTVCAIVGFLFGIFLVIRKCILPNIAVGFTSLAAIMLFVGGLIMLMVGVMGEYIGRIYITLCNMPQYEVRESINYNEESDKV